MSLRVWYALFAIAVGVLGLGLDFYVISGVMTVSADNPVARSLPDTLVYYWTFLTHLSNLGLILVYLADITSWRVLGWFRRPVTRASLAGIITLVMLFFHFMLAPHYHFTSALLAANYLLHYVAPLLYLLWWLVLAPHGALRFRDVPWMLWPGILYVAWVLLRGLFAHEYPYDILDAGKNGYGAVAIGVLVLLILVGLFCCALVMVDRLVARRTVAG
jgi:hypothetical protein